MYIQNMANYPDWVMKYKKKGTLVQRKRDDLYYMYRVHSIWNKEKKSEMFHASLDRIRN
jgi:hypothetical protein